MLWAHRGEVRYDNDDPNSVMASLGCCGHVVVRRLRGKVRFMSWRTWLLYYNFPLCLRAALPIPLGAVLVGPTASYSPRCELLQHLLGAEANQIEWCASAA